MASYDSKNVFAKIIRKEIPARIIKESTHSLAFYDAFPKAKIHALVIPKGAYINLHDFCANAPTEELRDFWKTVNDVIDVLDISTNGFRMISNSGTQGGQEVPHFHIHLLGGQTLGPMLSPVI